MVGAVEKQKLVYILNRDADKRLTVSSPLEGHKSHMQVVDCVGLDVGFDNPVFCALELELERDIAEPANTLLLTHYELDLGLNHVVRKQPRRISGLSNRLCAVPGGGEGPGGVVVCGLGTLTYYHNSEVSAGLTVRLPGPPQLIVAHATHRQRTKFFLLLQSESGTVWKVTLEPTRLVAHHLDTLAPSTSLAVMRNGFLFAAHSGSPCSLYQFAGIGDANDALVSSDGVGDRVELLTRPNINLMPVWIEEVRKSCFTIQIDADSANNKQSNNKQSNN
jgi:splicing factor 3B subunit 3